MPSNQQWAILLWLVIFGLFFFSRLGILNKLLLGIASDHNTNQLEKMGILSYQKLSNNREGVAKVALARTCRESILKLKSLWAVPVVVSVVPPLNLEGKNNASLRVLWSRQVKSGRLREHVQTHGKCLHQWCKTFKWSIWTFSCCNFYIFYLNQLLLGTELGCFHNPGRLLFKIRKPCEFIFFPKCF